MSSTKPIEDILHRLAEICLESLRDDLSLASEEVDSLLKSLSVNGWTRHQTDGPPLAVEIEQRAVTLSEADSTANDEVANHRERLNAAAKAIAELFHSEADADAKVPDKKVDSSPRNQRASGLEN